MSVPPNMPWNWFTGPQPVPNPTPPFRPDGGMDVGPAPPTGPTPGPQMAPMTEKQAIDSETGYYGPPYEPPGKGKDEKAPAGKVFIDRIEDNGKAVLLAPGPGGDWENYTKTNIRAMPGWKEGMYIDPPRKTQGSAPAKKRKAIP